MHRATANEHFAGMFHIFSLPPQHFVLQPSTDGLNSSGAQPAARLRLSEVCAEIPPVAE